MKPIKIHMQTIYSNIQDNEAIQKARSRFSFYYDNYERSHKYISGQWDGKYYAITYNGAFQTGLIPLVAEYLSEFYDVEILDYRSGDVQLVDADTSYLRPYQQDIVDSCLNYNFWGLPFFRGIINGAVNAGKTYMTAAIWEKLGRPPTIFLVHRTKLFTQQVEFFKDFFGDKWVGQVNDKKQEYTKPFVISMYRACGRINMKRFKAIVVDEAHMAKGDLYKKTVNKCKADVRYYITGTPFSIDPISQYKIVGSSGPELAHVTSRFLIDSGFSAEPNISMLKITNSVVGYMKWQEAYKELIVYNVNRNRLIQKFIKTKRKTRSCWVVCRSVEHAKLLADYCSAELLTGKTPKKEGDQLIKDYQDRKIKVVVSTMVIDVGMNLPIEAFVLALGGKSEVDIIQLLGRSERLTGGFDKVDVLDFYDIGPYVESHSLERIAIYEKEQFPVEVL